MTPLSPREFRELVVQLKEQAAQDYERLQSIKHIRLPPLFEQMQVDRLREVVSDFRLVEKCLDAMDWSTIGSFVRAERMRIKHELIDMFSLLPVRNDGVSLDAGDRWISDLTAAHDLLPQLPEDSRVRGEYEAWLAEEQANYRTFWAHAALSRMSKPLDVLITTARNTSKG